MDQRELIITIALGVFFAGHIISCLSGAWETPIKQTLGVLALIAIFVLTCFVGNLDIIMSWPLMTLLLNITKCLSATCAFLACLKAIVRFFMGYYDD